MAGAGYDVSNSRAEAQSLGLTAASPTVFNFGDKANVTGGWYDQDASPTASASAARNLGENSQGPAGLPALIGGMNSQSWLVIGGVVLATLAVAYLVTHRH